MLILLAQPPTTPDQLTQAGQDLAGYIKYVVDLKTHAITIGGTRHFDGQQLLLARGSKQSDLWGGGLDPEHRALDFESMINIRPSQDNPSREVLDMTIRQQITAILVEYKLWQV